VIRIPVNDKSLVPLNQPCILAIRPDTLVLTNGGDKLENAIPATVREINFAGATSSVKLDANGLDLEALALMHRTGHWRNAYRVLPEGRIALLTNE